MNVKEAIKKATEKGGVLVYELYDKKLDNKIGRIYLNYDECITRNFFDIDEFLFISEPLIYNPHLFDDGLFISHTDDYNWYIVATRLQ